jgi:sulfotransferase
MSSRTRRQRTVFNHGPTGSVYSRVEALTSKDGFVKRALGNLRQAWFGEFAGRLIAIRYESLVQQPNETIDRVYDLLNEPRYAHDFDNVEYDEPLSDANMGLPGFHRVSGPVRAATRETILPPDVFAQHDRCFWNAKDQNPQGVLVL